MTPIEELPADAYPILCEWWVAHGWTPPPQKFLPACAYWVPGVVAAFLYRDPTSAMAGIEWLVTNPQNTAIESARSILDLVDHMSAVAKESGAQACFTSCVQPSLGRFYQAAGFQVSDQHVTHYLKLL